MQTTVFCLIRLTTWENLPHAQDSLKQHVLRATHQAAFVWAQSLMPMYNLSSPDKWGWNKQGNSFLACCMTQPSVSVDVRWIRDVLDVAPVRKLDYHAQKFVNVVESVIEHKVVLCFLWDSQVTVFDFLFVFCVFCWELHLIVLVTCQKNLTLPKQKH